MLVSGAQLSRASGKSPPYISAETKRGNLVKGPDKKYDISDSVNKNWLIKNGIRVKNNILVIDPLLLVKVEKKKQAKPKSKSNQTTGKKKPSPKSKKPTKSSQKKSVEKPKILDKQKEKIKKYEKKGAGLLSPVEFEELIESPSKLKEMTLEQLVLEHSHIQGVKTYAETLDKMMSALKKSVEIKKIRHELIDRDFVLSHVFSYLNILSERIFDRCGTDKKMLKDFTKMIKESQRQIDDELKKLQKIQETAAG